MSGKLKSALELAMEKYNVKADSQSELTEAQKAKIAEIRNFYQSKKAELEILYSQDMKSLLTNQTADYQVQKEKREQQYVHDRARFDTEEEKQISEVKKQS